MSGMRSCIKTGCRWPAAATLAYRYSTAQVWLTDLQPEDPATHDLCPHHADAFRVPRGWTVVDDRHPVAPYHEPTADEIVQRVASLRGSVDRMLERQPDPTPRRSRYAELLANLPTYDPVEQSPAPAPQASDDPGRMVAIGVSHEMAPIVRELMPGPPATASSTTVEDHTTHAVVLMLPLRCED
ncbi:hypothetical protein BH24ACT15_BH24ACT15_00100 [soil metagenome]